MTRICVFTGSSPGRSDQYREVASTLGTALVEAGHSLVYGGAHVGLMGVVADAVLAAGGEAIGVLPSSLVEHEVAHEGLTELHLTDSMHERKALMAELSDAFVALPGGFGTLDEFFEALTWGQLGLHEKPCAFLNVAGYFDGLLTFIDHAVDERFLRAEQRDSLIVATDPAALLDAIARYQPTHVEKWIDRSDV
jgi:uncharacterized protein (TIGR00730 family)